MKQLVSLSEGRGLSRDFKRWTFSKLAKPKIHQTTFRILKYGVIYGSQDSQSEVYTLHSNEFQGVDCPPLIIIWLLYCILSYPAYCLSLFSQMEGPLPILCHRTSTGLTTACHPSHHSHYTRCIGLGGIREEFDI